MTALTFNCSLITDPTELALCNYVVESATPLSCNGSLPYTSGGACFNYDSAVAKSAALLGDDGTMDTGNNAFMLMSTALVFIMTPGVGIFYAGLAGEESVSNTLMMSFSTICVVTVQWFLFGYSFAFGPGTSGFGSFQWGAMWDVGGAPSGVYGFGIPHLTYAVFQLMFAIITPALISGAVIGRMKFTTFLLFTFIWTTCIYDTLAHWLWSFTIDPDTGAIINLGWLGSDGALDFAGGSVIHISSGFAALACAMVLGKRHNYGEPVKPHNNPLVMLGGSLVWMGWFGFNAGSAGGAANVGGVQYDASGNLLVANGLASTAFINSHLAASAGAFTWMVMDKIVLKTVTPAGVACGGIAGLVAITPGAGFVDVWASIMFGIIVVPFCYFGGKIKVLLGADDTLDSFSLHGIGGAVGAFLTGCFATENINFANGAFYGYSLRLAWNCADIAVAGSFSFTGTLLLMMILKRTVGIRIPEEAEKEGIDKSEHGGSSYIH